MTSKTLPLTELEDSSETRLAQKISQLTGVGLVSISGGQRPAVRIQFNPQALAAYGLNIDDVRTTIGNFNVNTPKGNFDGPAQAHDHQRQRPDRPAPRNTPTPIIAYRNGAPVRLSDVATVVGGAENTKLGAWANTTPAIILNVQRQPGANIIQVVDRIKTLLPQIMLDAAGGGRCRRAQRPHRHHPRLGRRRGIRAGARGRAWWCMVIFLFLRTLPGTIIPSLSVPLSLVGTLGVDVSARLQPRQSVADGADHRHRLRGRRRHRHDREHRPLRRRRHAPAGSGAARLGSRSASPSFR